MSEIFRWAGGRRLRIPDLSDLPGDAAISRMRIDPSMMRVEDVAACRWLGFRALKGVTDPARDVTIVSEPHEGRRGLHADLVAGLDSVDAYPLCYDLKGHRHGFGGFVRWIYLSDPSGRQDVLGLDFSLDSRPTSGVAVTVRSAARTTAALIRHGLPPETAIALLDPRICEEPGVTAMRETSGLHVAADWLERAPALFREGSPSCPRCGQRTLDGQPRFCHACGCNPELVRKGT